MNVGQRIKELRKQNNMDQLELAKRLNVSNKTISSWEQNRTQPKMEMIEAMCKIFQCTKADFVSERTDLVTSNAQTDVFIETKYKNSDGHLSSYADKLTNESLVQLFEVIKDCNDAQVRLITAFVRLLLKHNYLSEEEGE